MKTTMLICAAAFLAGCAHYSENDRGRGRASPQSNIQSGTSDEDYFPYRSGPGLPSTDRAFPLQTGSDRRRRSE